jgi:Domain of unknown function (DUF4168)
MKQHRWPGMGLGAIALVTVMLVFASIAAAQKDGVAVSDNDFATFVLVNVELQNVSDEFQAAFNQAGDDPAKRAALEQEVQVKSKDVLAKNNLTAERYREIYKTVNADPELRNKALQQIQQERQKPGKKG